MVHVIHMTDAETGLATLLLTDAHGSSFREQVLCSRDKKPFPDSFIVQVQYYANGLAYSGACLAGLNLLFHILDFAPRSAQSCRHC